MMANVVVIVNASMSAAASTPVYLAMTGAAARSVTASGIFATATVARITAFFPDQLIGRRFRGREVLTQFAAPMRELGAGRKTG